VLRAMLAEVKKKTGEKLSKKKQVKGRAYLNK
jgi:hypothetical protein